MNKYNRKKKEIKGLPNVQNAFEIWKNLDPQKAIDEWKSLSPDKNYLSEKPKDKRKGQRTMEFPEVEFYP